MFEPFQLPFVQRGLVEVLILSVGAGVLGTWIVLRGLAFFSHAVGTATFPGLVLADGIGFSAPLGAFGVAVAFTASVWGLARRRGHRVRQPHRARSRRLPRRRGDPGERRLPLGVERRAAALRQPAARRRRGHPARDRRHRGDPGRQPPVRPPLARDRVRRGWRPDLGWQLARRRPARPDRPGDHGRAQRDRRAAGGRAVRGPGGDGAAVREPDGLLADRDRASRRRRGDGRALALGEDQRPPGATIATLSGAVFGLAAVARAVGPRGRAWRSPGARRRAARRRLRELGIGLGQGVGGRHHDPDRRLRARGRRQRRRRPSDPRPQHRSARLRAAAGRRHDHGRREGRLHQRRQPRRLDGQGRRRQRQRREGRRPGRHRPGEAAGRVERPGGLPVRPALVA